MIHLEGVGKTYGLYRHGFDRVLEALTGRLRHQEIVALHPMDIHVGEGEIVGLVGKNGAGKSTLLKLVSGMLRPTVGDMRIRGKVAPLLELGAGFHPDMTGRENLYLVGAAMGLDKTFIRSIFDDIVGFAEIGHFIDMPVKTYSSGMFVRLAFSLATCVRPNILIIDEALSVGDGGFARRSFDRIMKFRDAGVTILFCSHSMYQVEALCKRVVWLKEGHLVMDGDSQTVVARYNEWLNGAEQGANTGKVAAESSSAGVTAVRAGSQMAQLRQLDVSVDGNIGESLQLQCNRSDLRISAVIASDPELPEPTFAVAFREGDGRIIASAGSSNDGVSLKRDSRGISSVDLNFPRIALLKGRYYLDVYVLCEKAVHAYDAVENVITLEVSQDGLEQGVVSLRREWS